MSFNDTPEQILHEVCAVVMKTFKQCVKLKAQINQPSLSVQAYLLALMKTITGRNMLVNFMCSEMNSFGLIKSILDEECFGCLLNLHPGLDVMSGALCVPKKEHLQIACKSESWVPFCSRSIGVQN